jgi:hypothetical protein
MRWASLSPSSGSVAASSTLRVSLRAGWSG